MATEISQRPFTARARLEMVLDTNIMLSPDTEPWADQMQIDLLRKAGPQRRLTIALQLSAMVWNASRSAVDRYYPHETQDQRDLRFLTQCYGRELAEKFIAHRQKVLGFRNETIVK